MLLFLKYSNSRYFMILYYAHKTVAERTHSIQKLCSFYFSIYSVIRCKCFQSRVKDVYFKNALHTINSLDFV